MRVEEVRSFCSPRSLPSEAQGWGTGRMNGLLTFNSYGDEIVFVYYRKNLDTHNRIACLCLSRDNSVSFFCW